MTMVCRSRRLVAFVVLTASWSQGALGLQQSRGGRRATTVSMISERQIPAYQKTMPMFESKEVATAEAVDRGADRLVPCTWDETDGHLIHHSTGPLFAVEETEKIIAECEARAASIGGWTTARHANYPTTDVPLAELPQTMNWFREEALPKTIYPFLQANFAFALPDPTKLRVVDAFVVKYNATAGQSMLKSHRDGSVLSFNVALNDLGEYDGGGTWFEGMGTAVRSDRGHLLGHASGLLHGGHPITSGVRYILVAFVILKGYPNYAYRFYEHVRNS